MATKTNMQQLRGTSADWQSVNPTLLAGQIGFVTDLKKIKVGDGTTAFNDLPYVKIDLGDINGLIDSNGKINTNLIPSLALVDNVLVATEAEKLALTTTQVQNGDVVIVTETQKSYFVIDDTKLDNEAGYRQILTPAAPVQSVNGKTGAVALDTDDVTEGSNNLYYTQARFDTAFAAATSAGLSDGDTILHENSIIDGGEITAE